jgi:adenylate cyclase
MTLNLTRDFAKILQFGILWLIGGFLYSIIEYGILGNSEIYPSTKNLYDFKRAIISSMLSSLIIGLLIGLIEIKFVSVYFQVHNFWKKIVFKALLYLTLIIVLLLTSFLILSSSRLSVSIFHEEALASIIHFVCNFSFWSIIIFAGFITVFTLFIAEVSNYLGASVFSNFFTGKYHHPIEEERIFMFLDMNASTTIAEKLGHKKYFQLLKKYYSELTEAIIQTGGEVYQYAGDEIIVSWDLEKGLENNNCIQCFILITESFQKSADDYIHRFGLAPKYKAGFHYGEVTTGEIGVLKKEIFFTGDVLNTTARIQSACSKYKTDILISKDLLTQLDTTILEIIPIGECELKGRNEKMNLFTLKLI